MDKELEELKELLAMHEKALETDYQNRGEVDIAYREGFIDGLKIALERITRKEE